MLNLVLLVVGSKPSTDFFSVFVCLFCMRVCVCLFLFAFAFILFLFVFVLLSFNKFNKFYNNKDKHLK